MVKYHDSTIRQFLIIVKPSGEVDFDAVRRALSSRQCVYGFDVAGEDQKFKLRSSWEFVMGRRKRETPSSLELFLDTICNTFGGIVFLAILLSIIVQNRTRHSVTPTQAQW